MSKILKLNYYSAEQIADSINSIWVGEYGYLDRGDYACGVVGMPTYAAFASTTSLTSFMIDSILIEVYCGSRHKADRVRNIMIEKGFKYFETPENWLQSSSDSYIVFIGKPSEK